MTNIRNTKLYKNMDSYQACSIIEGFDGEDHTQDEIHAAWQALIDSGECWHLQGFYGRTASDLIESGLCLPAKKSHRDYYGNIVQGTDDK